MNTIQIRRMGPELSQLAKIASALSDSVVVVDSKLTIVLFNPVSERLFDYEAEEVIGKPLNLLVPDDSQRSHREVAKAFMANAQSVLSGDSRKPMRGRRRNGDTFPIEVTLTNLVLDSKQYALAISRDTTRYQLREMSLLKQAETDLLTGLFNRTYLERFGNDFFGVGSGDAAMVFIDLDYFKDVNDELGHECGDILLQAAAGRIRSRVKESDAVIRYGGDEIIVMLSDVDDRKVVLNVVEGIMHALSRTFRVENHAVNISASIGVALYPDDGRELEDLIRKADQAMYRSKQKHNCCTFYDELGPSE